MALNPYKKGDWAICIEENERECKANGITFGKMYRVIDISQMASVEGQGIFIINNNNHRSFIYSFRFKKLSITDILNQLGI